MDTSPNITPPTDHKPNFQRISDSSHLESLNVNKNKRRLPKIMIGLLIVIVVATGTSLYLWQNDQVNIKKNADIATAKKNEEKAAEQKKASESSINNTIPLSDYVGSGTAVRARSAKAQSNAETARTVTEMMNAEKGYYPRTTSDYLSGKLPSDIIPSVSNPTVDNGLTTFRWEYSGPLSAPTGGRITYWDYTTNAISTTVFYVGSANSDSKFVTPES